MAKRKTDAAIYRHAARRIAEGRDDQICYALCSALEDEGLYYGHPDWRRLNDLADGYISSDGVYLRGRDFGMPKLGSPEWPKEGREHRVIALLTLAAAVDAGDVQSYR